MRRNRKKNKKRCPLTPPGGKEQCPLEPASGTGRNSEKPEMLIVRSEHRSWITIAITAFGALLLRYLRTVRERVRTAKKRTT